MENGRYEYPIIVACKVIIRKGDRILLIREPDSHTWMPGRLGLPGGKLLLHESISVGLKRKIREETGLKVKITGLFKIVDILLPEKTVYHFIFLASYLSQSKNKNLYSEELEWFSEDDVKKLDKDDCTEFYFHEVLGKYFTDPKSSSLDIFLELEGIKDEKLINWIARGTTKKDHV